MNYSHVLTVISWMYRGTAFTLRLGLYDDDGDEVALSGSEELKLRLAASWADKENVLEISGTVVDASTGKIQFEFAPADTEDLVARAYDMTILVDGEVALQDKFGIVAQNPS